MMIEGEGVNQVINSLSESSITVKGHCNGG
jgi:hypothetical protein